MDRLSMTTLAAAKVYTDKHGGGGGGGTSNYNALENLPQINSITLTGDKSLSDLGIIAEIKKAMDMITGYFDNTADYSAGDIVVYDKKLYKFTVDHTAGDWNSLEVSPTTVEELLSDIVDGMISKDNLKLASSGTTASGEIRFGVDGQGRYGYIKAGADSVTPFKNPTGNKAIGTITENGVVAGIDVEDFATASLEVAVPQPSGTKNISITQNGTTMEDVTNYANAEISVNVPVGAATGKFALHSSDTAKKIICGFKPSQVVVVYGTRTSGGFSIFAAFDSWNYQELNYHSGGTSSINAITKIGTAPSSAMPYIVSIDNDGFTLNSGGIQSSTASVRWFAVP